MFNNKELTIIYKKLWENYKNLSSDEKELMYKIESIMRNTPEEEEEEEEEEELY